MTLENVWMMVMATMFGLFLAGVWIEARRFLRDLAEESRQSEFGTQWEKDYHTCMARLDARTKLAQMRATRRGQADFQAVAEILGGQPQMHLVEGGARTPMTRERRRAS